MFIFKDANSFIFKDANSFIFPKGDFTYAGYDATPTGTTLFKAIAPLLTEDIETPIFPTTNANDVKDQYMEYLSEDTGNIVLTITFPKTVDTLFIANINFSFFQVTVDGDSQFFVTFQNQNTGRWNAVVFFDGGVDRLTFRIPGQTPLDSAAYFSIGVLCGGNRITLNPRYQASREIVEPSTVLRFDRNNKEVNNSLRPYHMFNINFKDIVDVADLNSLKTLENSVGMDDSIIVYENYSDRETGIIGERTGTFNSIEKAVSHYDSNLMIKELT